MKLLAICTGIAERLPGKSYKTGIYKAPVNATVIVDRLGLVGDAVCNVKHHGGPDQALLVEGSLTLDWWAEKLGRELPFGTFGENLVIEGLDNRDVAAGDRFYIGDVVIEATSPRIPCNTLAARMEDAKFALAYRQAGRPGIYCRVIETGAISPGIPVGHQPFVGERLLIATMLAISGRRLPEAERARCLAAPVGARFREMIERGS